ncbi:MAG: hypothetical protein JOZ57_08420 [Abitibacteriaceae bacterium]|nr:hypothetical protein [Abditibacteriaceae bacterium]
MLFTIVAGFLLMCGFVYVALLALVLVTQWFGSQATQRRAAKAKDIAQHSVTVEVD